jgi:hypothetical protein
MLPPEVDVPSDITGLLVIIGAVLPGATYTWAFENQAGPFGLTLADRTLRFTAVSILFHLVLGWPEYGLYRVWFTSNKFGAGQFAAAWATVVILTIIPALFGWTLGRLYATRNSRSGMQWIRKHLSAESEARLITFLGRERAPRAWDHVFSERPLVYVLVRTTSGEWLAGAFADHSYAAGNPNDTDIYLEEAWELTSSANGNPKLGRKGLGYSLYIPANQIEFLQIVGQQSEV